MNEIKIKDKTVFSQKIIKGWLAGILLLLPFQDKLKKSVAIYSKEFSYVIAYLDEITIVVFLLLAIKEFFKDRETYNKLHLILLFPIIILSFSGLVSGLVNENPLLVTVLGIHDYIKNFFVIFIYAAFFRELDDFKKIFRILLVVTVFLGIIALIQELWAVWFRCFLKKDIHDIRYLLVEELSPDVAWRFGIYNVRSIIGNNIVLGLYCTLIVTIYLNISRKINFAVFIPLFSGILFSASRIVYTSLAFITGFYFLKNSKWLIALAMPVVLVIFYMGMVTADTDIGLIEGKSFRSYTKDKAIEFWKENKLLGIGPGMYGGIVSIKMKSPYYEWDNYYFLPIAKSYVYSFKGIDQFWPHILAETGIWGTVSFIILFISLLVMLSKLRRSVFVDELRGLYTALIIYTYVILIYSMGSGLNVASVLFTYCAFVGMGLGIAKQQR